MSREIYALPLTSQLWTNAGGGSDLAITLASLSTGAGRIGAQWDRGTGAQPGRYRWQFRCRTNSAPTVGNTLRIYLAVGDDGTYISNGLGTADAAISSEALCSNCQYVDSIEVSENVTTRDFTKRGFIWIYDRYVSPIIFNAFGVSLSSTGTNMEFRLTPYPDQIQ